MGMLVVKGRSADAESLGPSELELIDGQQRLTTTVLLMDAIVDALALVTTDESKRLAEDLRYRFIRCEGRDRLRLNKDCRDFFAEVLRKREVHAAQENRSQKNLHAAAEFFRTRLEELGEEQSLAYARIERLVRRMFGALRFLLYPVTRDAAAGLIFEVMNNRGRALSQADRVKNYLMYVAEKALMHEEGLEDLGSHWGQIFKFVMQSAPGGELAGDAEARLLRAHWTVVRDPSPPRDQRGWSISQRVRHAIPLQGDKAQVCPDILEYTRTLHEMARWASFVLNPTQDKAHQWADAGTDGGEIVDALGAFSRMSHVASCLPLLLAGLSRLAGHPESMLRLARTLETFAFRVYGVCNHRGHTGQSAFRRLAHWLYRAPEVELLSVLGEVLANVDQWTGWYAEDEKFRDHLLQDNFYESHSAQEIRFFLYEYERELAGGQRLAYEWTAFADGRKTQIEHVFPRNPRDERFLGRTPERHATHVHRLGNLTVTRNNPQLSNRHFAQKKPIYRNSPVVIERSIAEHRVWTMKQVNERGAALADFALRRWPRYPSPT